METDQFIPKYYTISQQIISKIQNGELQPGMKIPSENEIISRFEVSNTTARKILQELESAGWVVRIKGKGTYVKTRDVERSVNRILGFTKNMIEAGQKPATRVLETRILKQGYSGVINGRLYAIREPVFRVRRLRFADDIPMMLETRFINLTFCPGIETHNFESSLYDLYRDHYGLSLTEVLQMLSAIIIQKPSEKQLFGITGDIPAFFVEGVTFCGKEMILEMEESVYRGDKYRFSVRAH